MRLVMVMKVKDEEDILDDNLRFHSALGVDFFIVTDNGSTDSTPQILARWERAGRLRRIFEPSDEFRDRAHGWITRMAREAATEHGADWVLHCDADELWWPLEGDLRQAFAGVPDRYGVVVAPRLEFQPRPDGPGHYTERLTIRETRSSLRPKLAHRGEPDVVLHRGAHDVYPEGNGEELPKAGRPVLRAVREADPEDDGRLIFAPAFPAWVAHYPMRSYEQYRRRVEVMVQASFEDKWRRELAAAYAAGNLPELYEQSVLTDEQAGQGIAAGRLARDERLRDFMASCPDPDAAARGERPGPPPAPDPARLRAERDEVTFAAMRAITRTEQSLIRQRNMLRRRLEGPVARPLTRRFRPVRRVRTRIGRALGR